MVLFAKRPDDASLRIENDDRIHLSRGLGAMLHVDQPFRIDRHSMGILPGYTFWRRQVVVMDLVSMPFRA